MTNGDRDKNKEIGGIMDKRQLIRVLVVEDEEIVAIDLRDMLVHLGYTVSGIARSGNEAVEKVEKSNPDLVLMDIMLGEAKDGIDTAEHIRTYFRIPVVYVTAYADESTLDRAKVTAPYGYIIKPFQEKELTTAITLALYRHDVIMRVREETENALAAIIGSAELMLEEPPERYDEETLTKIEIIKRAASKIRDFIEEI